MSPFFFFFPSSIVRGYRGHSHRPGGRTSFRLGGILRVNGKGHLNGSSRERWKYMKTEKSRQGSRKREMKSNLQTSRSTNRDVLFVGPERVNGI